MKDEDYDHDSLTLFVYRSLNCILSHMLQFSLCHCRYSSDNLTIQGKRTQSRLLHYHHKVLLTTGRKTQVTYKVFYNTQLKVEGTTDNGQNTKQTMYKNSLLHRTEDIQHVQEGTQSEQKYRIYSCDKTQ